MRITFVLLSLCYYASGSLADNLLAEDDWQMAPGMATQEPASVTKGSSDLHSMVSDVLEDARLSVQQTFAQGRHLESSRTEARMLFERALWRNSYINMDARYAHFAPKDRFARVLGDDFSDANLKTLWLQQTHQECAVKLGRQSQFWGAVEGAFAVDVLMPFDFTEPLLTDFADIRRSQDMAVLDCFFPSVYLQAVYTPKARLDQFHPKPLRELKDLEDSLEDEWGGQVKFRLPRLDISLFAAHLYQNMPLPVVDSSQSSGMRLLSPRYDFFGASTVWANGRWLWEMDVGYKTDQRFSSGLERDIRDLAIGFEYVSTSNHQWSAGLTMTQAVSGQTTHLKEYHGATLSWSNTYLNDDLTLSCLGNWMEQVKQSSGTVQALIKLNDEWEVSTALGYRDMGLAEMKMLGMPAREDGWNSTVKLKVTF
jgi:hypothetical protein